MNSNLMQHPYDNQSLVVAGRELLVPLVPDDGGDATVVVLKREVTSEGTL
jgi:hypothetical protein